MEMNSRGTSPTAPSAQNAPEVRYRVKAANSAPRRIKVIALSDDDPDVRACAANDHANVQFARASELAAVLDASSHDAASVLHTIDTASPALAAWLGTPDLVAIVGRAGDDARAGALAAQAYRSRGVTVSGLIGPARDSGRACAHGMHANHARTAHVLRPLCTMLILPHSPGYLEDLLGALGA
jgi:hypothetical protein